MKTYRPWALSVVLALPVLALAADQTPVPCAAASSESGPGIEITDLIDKVAKRTGKQFIVDPRVRIQVSSAGLDFEKVDYPMLLAILNVHQFGTYEANGIVRVVPDANARQWPNPVTTEISPTALDDEYVTVLITAKNMCVMQAVPVLRPLMPQAAHLAADGQSNSLIISDHVANARRVVDMVERLDKVTPAGQQCSSDSTVSKRDKK